MGGIGGNGRRRGKRGMGGIWGGGFGEVTTPPLCNLTQMTLMQVVHTETYLHRWEPLRKTLLIKRAVIWFKPGI